MSLIIRAVTVIDSSSSHHRSQKDILIENGRTVSISKKITPKKNDKVFEANGFYLTTGWCDTFAFLGDPGFEYKEDIESGLKAAVAGGFTAVGVLPNTQPVIQSKSEVEYLLKKSSGNLTDVLPYGATSVQCEGKDLAEMYDMFYAGAVAFTDGTNSIYDSGLMMRALQYASKIETPIISLPMDGHVAHHGLMHEGLISVSLGIKGIPPMAEELIVERDIHLAEYTGSAVHFASISTKRSVELIREAKKKNLPVTCGVNAVLLLLDDSEVATFDSNVKILPPLRSKEHIEALKKGLRDGTIDVICSMHQPQNEELKRVEFEYAAFGIINLQTVYAVAQTALRDLLTPEMVAEKFSVNPRKILKQTILSVEENEMANFTIFDPKEEWEFTKKINQSKSANSPFLNQNLRGRVKAVSNHNQLKTF